MSGVPVGFDHQALLAPEKVDYVRADRNVDLGLREPVATAEAEEQMLQLAPGVIGPSVAQVEVEELRLRAGVVTGMRLRARVLASLVR